MLEIMIGDDLMVSKKDVHREYECCCINASQLNL